LPGLDELPEVPPFLPGTPIGGHQADDYAPPPRYQTPSPAPGASPLRLEGELIKWPNDTESAVPATPAADELWSPDVFGEDSGTVELAGAVVV